MAGLIDRIVSLSGTEFGKATDLGYNFFHQRMGQHNHAGLAIIESAAEVARNHPNLVGVGVGLIVEQFLAEQKRRHDVYIAEVEGEARGRASVATGRNRSRRAQRAPLVHHRASPMHLRPAKIALEVFGALVLLKLSSSGLRWFRHDKQHEVWFAPAARIRLWSGTIATYQLVKAIKSPRISAWRNATVALFLTRALQPVLRPRRQSAMARVTNEPTAAPPAPPIAATLPAEVPPADVLSAEALPAQALPAAPLAPELASAEGNAAAAATAPAVDPAQPATVTVA